MNKQTGLPQVLVKRSTFARMANVTPGAITKAVKNFDIIAHPSGLIDVNLPLNNLYLIEHSNNPELYIEPQKEFKPFDTDISNLWLLVKMGDVYRPVMAVEFSPGEDIAVKEIFFPHEETVSIIKKNGIVQAFEINGKSYKPFYATLDRILQELENE